MECEEKWGRIRIPIIEYVNIILDLLEERRGRRGSMEQNDPVEGRGQAGALNEQRSIVALGWLISLKRRSLTISEKSLKKALGYFFSTNLKKKLSLKKLLRLASFAQRLTLVLPELKILLPDLYLPLIGMNNMRAEVTLPEETVTAILFWRAALLLYYVENLFERPLESMRIRRPAYLVEFDGSLTGWGLRIYRVEDMMEETLICTVSLGAHPRIIARIKAHPQPSSYQNAMEMIAFTMGLVVLASKGFREVTVMARGDSISALEWMTGEKFKAGRSRAAVTLFLELCRRFDFQMHTDYTHLSSEENDPCDRLARQKPRAPGSRDDAVEYIHSPVEHYARALVPLAELCDPTQSLTSAEEILDFWVMLRELLDEHL
jgi:ribonuclease HI